MFLLPQMFLRRLLIICPTFPWLWHTKKLWKNLWDASTLHDVHCTLIQVRLGNLISCPSLIILRKQKRSSANYLPYLMILSSQEHLHMIFPIGIVRSIKIRRFIYWMTFSHVTSIFHYASWLTLQDVNPFKKALALIPLVGNKRRKRRSRGGWIDLLQIKMNAVDNRCVI